MAKGPYGEPVSLSDQRVGTPATKVEAQMPPVRPIPAPVETLLSAIEQKSQELDDANRAVASAQSNATRVRGELAKLKDSLADSKRSQLGVTDHAVLRYAERALGLEPSEIRALIRAKVAPLATALGNGKYPVAPGCMAVVEDGTVVTIVPA